MAAITVELGAGAARETATRINNTSSSRRSARLLRALGSTLGAVGLCLMSSAAQAQDPAPQDPAPADPQPEAAPAEAPPAEAPATEAPAGEAPAGDAAGGEMPDMPIDDMPIEGLPVDDAAIGGEGEPMDEVVVTVDRRKKDLQDYSGVAASFSEKKLAAVGITNAREMASMVPGLQIGVQEGNTEVYIRGVGSDNNTELGDPAVALHLDGVYIPRPRGVGSMFYDIARVEVNSGPQGTLRGRNAMGGSVNIVSNRPKLSEFGANAEATFGTFAQRRYQGMVNIPVGDVLAFRFAGFTEVRDPYYINAGPIYDITAGENADSWAYRAQILYQPTKRFTALLGYDLTRERGTGYLGANYQSPLSLTDAEGLDVPFDVTDLDNPRRVYYRGMNPWVDMMHEGYRAELTFDTGPFSLQGVASYRRLKYEQWTGANAGAVVPNYGFNNEVAPSDSVPQADAWTNGFWDSRSQSLIAELRAFAPDDSRLRWAVGAFYFDEDQQVFLGQNADPVNSFAGGEFNMPNVDGNSIAGYADATFDVFEELRVLGGYRYTREEKSRTDGMWALFQDFPSGDIRFGTEGFRFEGLDRTQYTVQDGADEREQNVNLFLSGIESFGARDTLPQALCVDPPGAAEGEEQLPRLVPNENGSGLRCAYGVKQAGVPSTILDFIPQNNKTKNTFHDWRAGVEYDITKENLIYFTVTTGHKAGGFNDTAPGLMADQVYNSYYDPESVLAFELGSKNTFFDKDLKFNLSAFTYRYDDLVFQTIASVGQPSMDPVDPTDENTNQAAPNTAVRQNAKSTIPIYGLDMDVIYRLPAGLEAEVHALLMHAKFPDGTIARDTRISNTAANNYNVDLGGNWLPRVSPFTINYTLSQLIVTEIGNFDWVIQAQTRGKHYMSVYNGDGDLLPPAPGEMEPRNLDYLALKNGGAQRLTDVVPTYTRFDIGFGWKHPDGRIALNAFVNNVTDLYYSTSIISTPGLNLRFFNPPRTAGVRFRVDW